MIGSEDRTIGVEGNRRAREYFRDSKGPRVLVDILDAGHYSFSDMFQVNPAYGDGVGSGERVTTPGEKFEYLGMEQTYEIVNSYSVAFFGLFLKGIEEYRPWLSQNQFGELINHDSAFPDPHVSDDSD